MIKNILLGSILTVSSFYAYSLDRVLNEKPIKIPLVPDREVVIKFPHPVTHTEIINAEGNVPLNKFLRPDGVLLITATEAFGKARMVAPMIDGTVVVLDLEASVGAIKEDVVTIKKPTVKKEIKPTKPEKNPFKPNFLKDGEKLTKNTTKQQERGIGYNDMVRFAFRHYSGPSRLIGDDISAKKVNVSGVNKRNFLRLLHQKVSLKTLSQWKINDKYVTVLLVNNLSQDRVSFDPRALRGRIIFSAALHAVLEPQGSINDQSLWAVITAEPFNKAILK